MTRKYILLLLLFVRFSFFPPSLPVCDSVEAQHCRRRGSRGIAVAVYSRPALRAQINVTSDYRRSCRAAPQATPGGESRRSVLFSRTLNKLARRSVILNEPSVMLTGCCVTDSGMVLNAMAVLLFSKMTIALCHGQRGHILPSPSQRSTHRSSRPGVVDCTFSLPSFPLHQRLSLASCTP